MITLKTEDVDPGHIKIPGDYVPDAEQLSNMISSLRENGMLHPPIIKENREIVTGRLRVVYSRGILNPISCKVCPNDLDEDEYKIIAYHENLKRFNLPWHEQVVQERELHELRQAQVGIGKPGPRKSGWSIRNTAAELGLSIGGLSQDFRMAEAVLADPSLRKIQDKETAKKVILNSIKRINQEQGVSKPLDFDVDVCHHGSSEVILKLYDDNTFDACITDPPWLEYKDASLTKDIFTLPVFQEVYRVLKQNSFLYAFVSTQDFFIYMEEFQKIGFHVQKWPLIWVKEGVMSYGTRSWEYNRDYEPIILATKGSPALTAAGIFSSVMSSKVIPSASLVHPNEKPRDPIMRLIDNSTYEGSLILDPFAGSFIVPATCYSMRRKYVAIEREAKYYEAGLRRLGKGIKK